MNAKNYRIFLFSSIILIILATFVGFMFFFKTYETPQTDTVSVSEETYLYMAKEHENKIGIFKYGENAPYLTIDVYVYTLPDVDQQQLKSGIKIDNDESLDRFIEDYES